MLDHIDVPVSDLGASKAFYEAALAPLGFRVLVETATSIGLGASPGSRGDDPGGELWLSQSGGPRPPMHFALRAAGAEEVRAFHASGLAAGGVNNGRPRHRPEYHDGYFAAYLFDPDGNNVEAVFHDWHG
ncbi:MAG: VOC family protein [Actinomyces sp.]|nr:VOC family protein [Actinomyces sp.]MCI1642818.1 VOC family protein [Actinomyces sp.]MCI1663267.1 VOC family protein [Actinomyces sp.]MCI1692140.1 VOC family protein [Actinomyces sp.]MCI1788654.1 VOC family protein [Actinomyces sp.]MCI1829756.1 VOC family protein [Actinomyces sp.]